MAVDMIDPEEIVRQIEAETQQFAAENIVRAIEQETADATPLPADLAQPRVSLADPTRGYAAIGAGIPEASEEPVKLVPEIVERSAKRFINNLLLSKVEEARPSTSLMQGLRTMDVLTKKVESYGDKPIPVREWPSLWWTLTKTYFADKKGKEIPTEIPPAAALRDPATFEIAKAEDLKEYLVDIGVDLASFLAELAIWKKLLPASVIAPQAAQASAMAKIAGAATWEMTNWQGFPGQRAALGLFLAGTTPGAAVSLAGRLGMTSLQSGAFAAMAQLEGADLRETLVSAAIPWAFEGARELRAGYKLALGKISTWQEAQAHATEMSRIRQIGAKIQAGAATVSEQAEWAAFRAKWTGAGAKAARPTATTQAQMQPTGAGPLTLYQPPTAPVAPTPVERLREVVERPRAEVAPEVAPPVAEAPVAPEVATEVATEPTPRAEQTIYYHGSAVKKEVFDGAEFFTDSPEEATAYAEMKALEALMEEKPELSELVYDIMADEGMDEVSDMDASTIRDIAEANGIDISGAVNPMGAVSAAYLDFKNPADMRKYGSTAGSADYVSETWNELYRDGWLAEGPFESLDEMVQQEIIDDYADKAIYKLFEKEGVYAKAFAKGHDVVVFTDQGLGGKTTHTSYLVAEPAQIRSYELEAQPVEPAPDARTMGGAGAVLGGPVRAETPTGILKPSPKHLMSEMSLLKLRYRAEARGARAGAKVEKAAGKAALAEQKVELKAKAELTADQIQAYKDELSRIVRENLAPDTRGAALTMVTNVSTQRQLTRAIAQVGKIAEKADQREAMADLKNTEKELDLKHMREGYASEIAEILDKIDLAKPTKRTISRLESMARYIEKHPENSMPPGALAQLSRLSKKPIANMTADEIRLIDHSIRHLKKLNDLTNKLVFGKRRKDSGESALTISENMTKRGRGTGVARIARTVGALVSRPFRSWWAWTGNIEIETRILDGKDDGEAMRLLYGETNRAADDFIRIDEQQDQPELHRVLKERGVDLQTAFVKWGTFFGRRADEQSIKLPNGETAQLTKAERVSFFLAARDPKHLRSLVSPVGWFTVREGATSREFVKHRPLSAADIATIDASMTAEERNLALAFADYINGYNKAALNAVSEEVVGFPIAVEENYWSKSVHPDYIRRGPQEAAVKQAFIHKALEGHGIWKERRDQASAPVIVKDAFEVMARIMHESAAYRAYAMPLRNIKAVLNFSGKVGKKEVNFRQEVRKNFGSAFLHQFEDKIMRVEDNSYDPDPLEGMLRLLRGRASSAILIGKPIVWVRQATSYPLVWNFVRADHFARYAIPVLTPADRKKADDYINAELPQVAHRLRSGRIGRDIGDMLAHEALTEIFISKPGLAKISSSPLRKGDSWAVRRTVLAALAEAESRGLEGAEKKWFVEKVFRRSNPQWHPKDRSWATGSARPAVQMFTMFRSYLDQVVLAGRHAHASYVESKRGPKDKAGYLGRLFLTFILTAELGLAIRWLRDKALGRKKRKDERAAWLRHITALAEQAAAPFLLLGTGASALAGKLKRGPFSESEVVNSPPLETINRTVDIAEGIIKTTEEVLSGEEYKSGIRKGEKKFVQSLKWLLRDIATVGGRLTGVPLEGLIEIGEAGKNLLTHEDEPEKKLEVPSKPKPKRKKKSSGVLIP